MIWILQIIQMKMNEKDYYEFENDYYEYDVEQLTKE